MRTSRALRAAARISSAAGPGMACVSRPSISMLSGALWDSSSTRTVSLPSTTSERKGVPCEASGVMTMASSDGATAGPPALTV